MFFAFLASPFGVDEIEGITVDEIETRAQLHNSCDPTSVCEDYFVGGFYSMDFIALVMFSIEKLDFSDFSPRRGPRREPRRFLRFGVGGNLGGLTESSEDSSSREALSRLTHFLEAKPPNL